MSPLEFKEKPKPPRLLSILSFEGWDESEIAPIRGALLKYGPIAEHRDGLEEGLLAFGFRATDILKLLPK